ncbi:MAG TPA: DinB superfamily protein [Flavobacterium sp.]|nr:DinB superfamily protein [Flavobacterium sp.]
MIVNSIKSIFIRDLSKLKGEIESYPNENSIWEIRSDINNSAGNLTLHLIGNLNTYIGAELNKTGYIRNRELEFTLKNIPRVQLIQSIEATISVIENVLDQLSVTDLKKEYPTLIWEKKTSTEYVLIHLTTHLAYHLGQINYHRRLLNTK